MLRSISVHYINYIYGILFKTFLFFTHLIILHLHCMIGIRKNQLEITSVHTYDIKSIAQFCECLP